MVCETIDFREITLEEVTDQKIAYSFAGGPFGSDLKASDYSDEGIRIIQLQNIKDGYFDNEYKIYTTKEKADQLIKCNIFPGDIIIAKMADPLARACIVPEHEDRYVMASDGIRLVVDENQFNKYYVLYYINSPVFRNQAIENGTGTTRLRIGLNNLRQLKVLVPSLDEQNKIAEILITVDNAISKTEAIIEQTEKVKKGLMQQLLSKGIGHTKLKNTEIGEIPEEWEIIALNRIIIALEAGVSVNSENRLKQQYEKGILKTSAVTNRIFNPLEHKAILPNEIERAEISPQKNCIIISRMNTPALVGASSYVDRDYDDLFLPDRLWQATIDEQIANSLWLSYILTWSSMRARIRDIATGTSGSMKNISKKAFLDLHIAFPKIEEQKRIANILSSIDEKIIKENQTLVQLKNIKKGLMQVLLTGKIRVEVDDQEVVTT
ncbi:restriction endonuclease subunit S [Paenibacillus ehimensis]|uniref:Restriction endonuclease subunit S n=1 Tax=Paenibacillus ehimensis TaxID=79264 RepID=A0ABT8VC60_9BACL|nr:restriction endonuclease subunit S [Paenibacillus ehimensis]MDO3678556.1 restriction endonuclease subunit S [Paenibacillus ehimensis]